MRGLGLLALLLLPQPAQAQDRVLDVLLGGFIVASFADEALTVECVSRGTCREGNPGLRWVIDAAGVTAGMTVKGAAHVGAAAMVRHAAPRNRRLARWVAVGLLGVQMAVVIHNVKALP